MKNVATAPPSSTGPTTPFITRKARYVVLPNTPQEVKVVGFGMIPDYIYQDLKLVQMRISEIEGVLLTMDLLDKKIRQYSMSKVKIYTEAEMIIS